MSEEKLMELLSKNLYQVELGPGGRGITELTKKLIEELINDESNKMFSLSVNLRRDI